MTFFKNKLKLNKGAVLLAFVHWIISFATDRLVFTYQLFDFSNTVNIAKAMLAWGAKLAFLGLLLILWHIIWDVVTKRKESSKEYKEYWNYTMIYFGIMLVFFILLFPGLWRLDEFGILKNAAGILPHFWQGYLTSVFYIFALMLVPNPAGVILVQIIVISLVVGYILSRCSQMIENKRLVFILYVPFLLFPVIDSNFYPIRMSIYAFLELLFAFVLFDIKYTKRVIKKNQVWLLALLAGVLICWRTESIYYIVLAPVTFVILFYKETSRKLKVQFVLATIVIASMLSSVQILGNKIESSKEYELTSIVLPITPLVSKANENGNNEMVEIIDKVLDTEILINGYQEGKTGIAMYWSESLTRNYTNADFEEMKRTYYNLILKYPDVFIRERLETFFGSTGILDETENLFAEDANINYINFREAYQYKEPPFRSSLVKILEFTDYETIHNLVYSFIPQAIILIGACFVLLIRRKWGYFFICGAVCAKIPLIFLTAPSRLFMYYYSIYLIGAVLIAMLAVFLIDKKFVDKH